MIEKPTPFNDKLLLNILAVSNEATAIYTTDDIVIQFANDAMLGFWGKDRSVIGLPLEEGVPELKGQPFKYMLQQVLRTGITDNGIISAETLINGELQTNYYEYEYRAIPDDNGVPYCVLHTAANVTERERNKRVIAQQQEEAQALTEELEASNEELRLINEELIISNNELDNAQTQLQAAYNSLEESEIALRLAIEAANFGTWHINSVTRAFITSARLRELFGYRADEEITIEDTLAQITDEYRGLVSKKFENAIYNGDDFDVTYQVVGYHDQVIRWLRAIGNLKADPSGEFSNFTGVVMDVSELRRDEQRKNDFIGMVSHELKTPLTSMKGYVQILKSKADKNQDKFSSDVLDKANNQVSKMTTLINGFLNVSRLESGKIQIDKQVFDMALLVKEVEEESITTITSHKVVFAPVVETIVKADRDKIGQVINNFISNAVKYSPAGSTIEVACITINGKALVSVKDQGMGIAPKDIDKLFERYYRVENNSTATIAGFGIGLYLSSEIVERHNGNIGVESVLGKGSTFWFTLPVNLV
ncbi:ATP-binding protein [Mucilaginibacter sp. PAMB04168]|uniref:PAS domain-containing sensor histidine kinase n=1 Tax=Mucilaginibacter sp. PAMB04168 TaxID=3138567 RepID=UPI0031F6ED6A